MRVKVFTDTSKTTVEGIYIATAEYANANYPGRWEEDVIPEPVIPPPVWEWFIDLGPFSDRLGAAAPAIDISTDPGVIAIRSDFARRKWIDLKDLRVAGALSYLAGQAHPVLGTLATPLISVQDVTTILSTPVTDVESLALRKLYFS